MTDSFSHVVIEIVTFHFHSAYARKIHIRYHQLPSHMPGRVAQSVGHPTHK